MFPLPLQVWTYCRLYRKFERFRRPELLDSAKAGAPSLPHFPRGYSQVYSIAPVPVLLGGRVGRGCLETVKEEEAVSSAEFCMSTFQPPGGEFLLRYARVAPPGKKCAFVLTRDGRPVKVQRTIFSECFYIMAMNELWTVTGEARYQVGRRKAVLSVSVLWPVLGIATCIPTLLQAGSALNANPSRACLQAGSVHVNLSYRPPGLQGCWQYPPYCTMLSLCA